MPYDRDEMQPLALAPVTEQRRLLPHRQVEETRAYLGGRVMQPAEASVKERLRTLRALDAKGQDRSHRWLGLTHSKEIDGKEEWTNRENRCLTFVRMPR